MDPRSEQYVESAKAGLTNVRKSLEYSPAHWRACTPAVKTCIGYLDQSRIMHDSRRLEERLWILSEIQRFAYFDADSGGVPEAAAWCEREWNRVLSADQADVDALTGLGDLWLSKAQCLLARIHKDEKSCGGIDDITADRRSHTSDYSEARSTLQPAVDFFAAAVNSAERKGRITGNLLEKRAEASMSLGNVSTARSGRKHFKDALMALKAAASSGYTLPRHLQQWSQENEFVLRI